MEIVRKYKKFLFLLGLLGWFTASTCAQVNVTAEVDSLNMIIGDRFQLHLSATYPKGAALESIDLSDLQSVENVDIEQETPWDTVNAGATMRLEKDLTLQVWDSGYYWIPEIPFVVEENGASNVHKTNRIPITVAAVVLQDSTDLADIKDIIREEANWRDYILYLVPFLLVALIGGLIYWWKRRKKMADAPPPPVIKLPAHEIAFSAFTQLKEEKLWQQGNIKAYQSRLTYIIREYLENRYEIPALESTTDEILRSLQRVDFDTSWKNKLQNILQVADLVKFAKAKPPADFHDKVLLEAEAFVEATKRQPVLEVTNEVTAGGSQQQIRDKSD